MILKFDQDFEKDFSFLCGNILIGLTSRPDRCEHVQIICFIVKCLINNIYHKNTKWVQFVVGLCKTNILQCGIFFFYKIDHIYHCNASFKHLKNISFGLFNLLYLSNEITNEKRIAIKIQMEKV